MNKNIIIKGDIPRVGIYYKNPGIMEKDMSGFVIGLGINYSFYERTEIENVTEELITHKYWRFEEIGDELIFNNKDASSEEIPTTKIVIRSMDSLMRKELIEIVNQKLIQKVDI